MAALFKRLLVIFAIILSLLILTVAAQDEEPQPEPEPTPEPPVQSPSPSPSPSPSISPNPSIDPGVPTPTSSVPVVPTGPPTPSPVFSTSTDCVACKPDYGIVSTCVQRIPKTANLTVITQVLPFYSCICPGNMIDSLQHCSTCLRSTGQLNFLNPGLYNVTNQQVKAMKEVCTTTSNGTQTPNGSSGSHWERLMASASWGAVLSVVVIVVSLGGM
ncbi:MAG: hypothetical protein J3R72DRAFT_446784 [Linnemannia gamsii]|nr:MAG: hypothetical protein J3R72DRAFT_446784 [Linnemannia gamsii]